MFGSSTQVSGGKVTKISTGTVRWQTVINVQSSGGDISGGTYTFLFTSGPSGSPFDNKWAGTTVTLNSLQSYSYNSGADNSITVSNGKYYTVNWKDIGYQNTDAIFMETSAAPVTITSVTDNFSTRGSGNDGTVTILLSANKSSEEKVFVRYTTDGWSTSTFIEATGSGSSFSAVIPAAAIDGFNGNDEYYVMTTTVSVPTHETADMVTLKLNNNSGSNYQLPVELTSFTADVRLSSVVTKWETATETDNAGFYVQRKKMNGWNDLGFIERHGTSSISHSYSYIDRDVQPGTYSYRLKQVDRSGSYKYSEEIELAVGLVSDDYSLSQNYPNPFNPSTTFTFALREKQFAAVKVFNLIGQEVASLFEGVVEPNQLQTIKFDGSTLPSGVYFYSLRTNNRYEVKKLLLSK